MADATQGDTGVQSLGLLVPALITLIAGLLIHSFIIGVNVSDWWKGRSVTAVDHIVTYLGMSRVCAQIANSIFLFVDISLLKSQDSYIIMAIIGSVHDLFSYANIWITSLLSIVLCLKISNFHSRLFLYLRGMILHRTGYLIVASGLLSASISYLPLMMSITNLMKGGTYNRTIDCTFNYIYNYTIGVFFPLLFSFISSVLLFSSLYHHTTKMKMSSNLSISLEKYYSTMRFVSITFIYNTLYFIVDFSCAFYYYVYCMTIPWLLVVFGLLPVLHSSYLIYTTAKLWSQMSKVLHNVTDLLSKRKDTETRENIEVVEW